MSEGNIRINKVLRELNISLERAVDYLKDKGIAIEASPNTKISDDVYNILCGQFAGDKGNKEASKGVSEEIRKEKEALRLEREKEIEDKRKADEERQRLEVVKAKVVVTGPKQVGKIDLEPKAPIAAPPVETPKIAAEPQENVIKKKEAAPVEEVKKEVTPKAEPSATEAPIDETITTQYQKLSGATLTGQVIDLSQFNKPKKKKEEFKKDGNKPATPGAGQTAAQNANNNANKNKRKRIAPKPGDKPAITSGGGNTQGGGGANKFGNKPGGGFQKGARPAIVQKVEPTEEEVKNQIKETLERLQGKGNKSKAAKYR
ncbi:MAG: translation initiation factor IF-2, partial [Flavobacterium sp.]|nr:translation initiation factor IF-2 [Flavobacterium sp.]